MDTSLYRFTGNARIGRFANHMRGISIVSKNQGMFYVKNLIEHGLTLRFSYSILQGFGPF